MAPPIAPLDAVQVGVAAACLVALPYALALAASEVRVAWRALAPRERVVVAAAAALGGALRVTVPRRIVTVFLGYAATRHAIELFPLPRYGAGATVVHAAWVALFGRDHAVILAGNALVGALALPLWAAVYNRWSARPGVAAAATCIVAAAPMFVRNDASDSNNVAAIALVAVSLLAHDASLRRPGPAWRGALAVAPPVVLATLARPDFVVVVPAAFALHGAWRGGWRVPWAVAAILELTHALVAAQDLLQRGSLPLMRSLLAAPLALAFECALVVPTQFPVALTLLAAWLALRGTSDARGLSRRHWLAALAAMAPTTVDLATANAARVHAPAAMLLAPAMAAALLAPRRPGVRAALVVAAALSAAPSAWSLFRPINDDHEEALLRDAAARTPPEESTLLRLGHEDRLANFDRGYFVHYEFPDYLFPRARASALAPFLAAPDLSRPVYFFDGMRCHARGRDDGSPPPPGDTPHPACAAMHARFVLTPVVARSVPNEGDHAFAWYPAAPRFSLGYYRVERAR